MTLVKDPIARAQGVKTRLQAARLHQQLETELALNDELPGDWETDAEQALSILEGRYNADELRDSSVSAGTARDGFIPSMSPGARRGLSGPHGGRRRAGNRKSSAPAAAPKRPAAKTRATGERRSPTRTSRRVGGRAFARTGLPRAADNATGLALQLVGVTVALTLIYVLIRGNGPRALAIAGGSFTTGLRAFISPTDPLAPAKATPKAAASSGPVPGNAYERGIAAGRLAGPPAPRLSLPKTHAKVIPR